MKQQWLQEYGVHIGHSSEEADLFPELDYGYTSYHFNLLEQCLLSFCYYSVLYLGVENNKNKLLKYFYSILANISLIWWY